MNEKPLVSLADFEQDKPWVKTPSQPDLKIENQIHGVRLQPIEMMGYKEGRLAELMTQRDDAQMAIPHVYRVHAAAGSVRGWVYHEWQEDRLTFTEGDFLFVLYDLRTDSPTYGVWNEIAVGAACPAVLSIPCCVVHGVKNRGDDASFVNLPTNFYDPENPDKFRIRYPDPRLPYEFA